MNKSFEFDHKLIEAVGKTKEFLSKELDKESFSVTFLQKTAEQAWEKHPHDQTLRMMAAVLQNMENKGKDFISRAELKDLYNKFATNNNKAVIYFQEELNFEPLKGSKILKRQQQDDFDIICEAIKETKDSSIYNSLNSLWDKESKNTGYKEDVAKKAEQVVNLTLTHLGIEPNNVSTYVGSDKCIVCNANYQTPGGDSNVLIPVEIVSNGTLLLPSVFVSKYGFADLNKEAVKFHIQDTIGKNLVVNGGLLLETLNSLQKLSSIDETELQIITAQEAYDKERGMVKLASLEEEGTPAPFTDNPIFISETDEEDEEEIPDLPESEGKETFASMLSKPSGAAEHLFGKKVVQYGRDIVINKFASLGFKPQVAVSSFDDDCVIYAAKIDSSNGPLGFEVLVDINEQTKTPKLPNILAAKDKVYDFSKQGIYQAISEQSSDPTMVALVSPLYDLKPSEILDRFRTAADKKDYKTAEDALNVLAINGPKEIYAVAVDEYTQSLSGKILKQASKCGCSMVIKVSSHSAPICGHLNLPLDKVYQDERGYCRPLYRKNMQENFEGVLFNTSKLFG